MVLIATKQAIQWMIADMVTVIEFARLITCCRSPEGFRRKRQPRVLCARFSRLRDRHLW